MIKVLPCSLFIRRKNCIISVSVSSSRSPGRLVGEDKVGIVHERACYGHTALLAAGKLGRIRIDLVAEPHGMEEIFRLLLVSNLRLSAATGTRREA